MPRCGPPLNGLPIGDDVRSEALSSASRLVVTGCRTKQSTGALSKLPPTRRTPSTRIGLTAPINSRLNLVVWYPTPFELDRNDCWPSRGSHVLRALPFIFSLCCFLNNRSRAAHSFKIDRLFSLFLFSCPSSSPHSPSLDEW